MRLSVRVKLVAVLAVFALLPLVAATLVIAMGGARLRSDAIGHAIEAAARFEARVVQVSLLKDIEKVHLALDEATVLAELGRAGGPRPLAELAELDRLWPTLPLTDPPMAAVLDNPIAAELKRIQREDPRFAEIFVTDRHGQLVAATGRTGDFYQADEDWWQGVAGDGEPAVFIPPVGYDASAGVWSIDVCIPLVSAGRLRGVVKAVLDVSRLLAESTVAVGELSASVMFVRRDGTIIYRTDTVPLSAEAEEWPDEAAGGPLPGRRVTSSGEIQAVAPIAITRRIGPHRVVMPEWYVVLYLSEAQAIGPVVRLSLVVLATGLLIVAGIFVLGLLLVDRLVAQRVYRLRAAARAVAEGDLSHRVDVNSPRRLWASDELTDLANDFNDMVRRVQESHDNLAAADQLKMDFIRVAGHELRTPVSYILGAARLLADSEDPEKLSRAVKAMGERAARLDEIIRAMFKLMPGQVDRRELRHKQVSVRELLEDLRRTCLPFVDQRNQQLVIETDRRDMSVRGDRSKLHDALEQLVINAIKFTPDGGVVKVRAGEGEGHVTLAIEDQGPGIPADELPHIFKPFYSGGDVMKHSSGRIGYSKRGMGLGLTVVKYFVELHGGTVGVSSGPTGCVFTVTIPSGPQADADPPGRASDRP